MRLIYLLYGVIAYALFFATFLYLIAFTGNYLIPGVVMKTIDSGTAGAIGPALLMNIGWLALFGLHHTITARPGFKAWLTKFLPPAIERSTYVLISSLLLVGMMGNWQPMTGEIWATSGMLAMGLKILMFAGITLVLISTFVIDHFDLFGLKQVYMNFIGKEMTDKGFTMNFLYKLVRHPLMTGWLIFFWATPVMTMGHLLYAGFLSAYILVALVYEERDLVAHFGDKYREYQRKVPKLIPFMKP